MELYARATAKASRIEGTRTVAEEFPVTADIVVTLEGAETLSEDAQNRIHSILRRESARIAEIAAVDQKDAKNARLERERLKTVPKDRPSIIVGVGTKDPESVLVQRGEFTVMGKTISAKPAKENDNA